jgi:hypothetical protein
MPSDKEEYMGYSIACDTKPMNADGGEQLWSAQAAIVATPGMLTIPNRIHPITGDRFKTEAEAREFVLRAAKQWIDTIVRRS